MRLPIMNRMIRTASRRVFTSGFHDLDYRPGGAGKSDARERKLNFFP